MKALFYSRNAHAWGHSVTALLQEIGKNLSVDESLINAAKNMDKFYIPPRYPNGFDVGIPADYFTEEDAKRGIEDARAIIQFCERHIS